MIFSRKIPEEPKNMGDWLGTGTVANYLKKYRPFAKARAYARKLNLNNTTEWLAFCEGKMPKLGRLPTDIPAKPSRTYADRGWKGMGDWLGTGTVANFNKQYRTFNKARTFARKLNLNTNAEWLAFTKGCLPSVGKLPADIPAYPNQTYADKGWKGMGDWLGNGRIRPTRRQKKLEL